MPGPGILAVVVLCLEICAQAIATADSALAVDRSAVAVGLYNVEPQDFTTVAAAGFDVVHSYRFETSTPKDADTYAVSVRAYLDSAQAHGLSVLLGLPRAWILAKDAARMRQAIELVRDHPALLAWYEEELGQQGHVDAIQALNGVVARSDSTHGLIIEEGRRPIQLNEVGCRRMFTYYPVTSTARKGSELGSIEDRLPVQELQRPFWPALQLFGRDAIAGYPQPDFVVPTRRELQYSLYSALVHGATGIFFYSYRQPTRYDPTLAKQGRFAYSDYRPLPDVNHELWASAVAVAGEAKTLIALVGSAGAVRPEPKVVGPPDLESAQWNLGTKDLLLIANRSYGPASVRVGAPSGATTWATLLGTGFSTPQPVTEGEAKVEIPGPGGVAVLFAR